MLDSRHGRIVNLSSSVGSPTRMSEPALAHRVALRSNDAIHLAAALRLSVDEMLTYDGELADACAAAGLSVQHPA